MSEPVEVTTAELAFVIKGHLDAGLIAFDVDGVLAPLVDHADNSRLLPGVRDALALLNRLTVVAIVSGRSLESLDRLFDFPADLCVIGSHGLEIRGKATPTLDDTEQGMLDRLTAIGISGVELAGHGAWLEYKPASVVVHTREADPLLASRAVGAIKEQAGGIDGVQVKPGNNVVELLARSTSKGVALANLAEEQTRSPIIFFGDDVTDEEAFKMMGDHDVSVRVGPGSSAARYRLQGPTDVAELLVALTN